jgi:hypothetical protein
MSWVLANGTPGGTIAFQLEFESKIRCRKELDRIEACLGARICIGYSRVALISFL